MHPKKNPAKPPVLPKNVTGKRETNKPTKRLGIHILSRSENTFCPAAWAACRLVTEQLTKSAADMVKSKGGNRGLEHKASESQEFKSIATQPAT